MRAQRLPDGSTGHSGFGEIPDAQARTGETPPVPARLTRFREPRWRRAALRNVRRTASVHHYTPHQSLPVVWSEVVHTFSTGFQVPEGFVSRRYMATFSRYSAKKSCHRKCDAGNISHSEICGIVDGFAC